MFFNQKIILVSVLDKNSLSYLTRTSRVYDHEVLVNSLLATENCLIGRKTFELTDRKGKNTWILSRDRNFKRHNVGTINSTVDIHLFTEGDLYVLGGISLFKRFEEYADELKLFIINNNKGNESWLDINKAERKTKDYSRHSSYSYLNFERK